jgi:hypothetical protein
MTDNPSASTRGPLITPAAPPPAADTQTPPDRVRIGSPAGLLAVIPVLLGFEPGPSFVVLGTEPPRSRVAVTLRFDLPEPGDPGPAEAIADNAVSVLAAQRIATAAAVGYGSAEAVAPVVAALRQRAAQAQITLTELLRAQDQRYWSYVCTSPACCPADGTPFDRSAYPATRALAIAGRPVLASREELRATLAPAEGEAADAMRRAVGRARRQLDASVARTGRPGHRTARGRAVAVVGRLAVAEAISRSRDGEPIGTELAAWLLVALRELRVRDDAWARMLPEHQQAHLRLWTELTRLAGPGYVAAPASLLAFVAWQSGDGALANIALDRALADSPRYSMARLLREVLDSGAPPSLARLPMTPEEVAASYAALDSGDEDAA